MIRPYEPSDEDRLIRLWLASTIAGQAFLPEQYWRDMEPEIRALMPHTETWVAEAEGKMVAFMALLGDLIGGLFTHPDEQGKGYGRALVEHARATHASVFVEVFEANSKAIGFYRSCGFVDHELGIDEGSGLSQLILRLGDSVTA